MKMEMMRKGVGVLALAFMAGGALAHPPDTVGTEISVTGNPTCKTFDTAGILFELKISKPASGNFTDGVLDVDLDIYNTADGWLLDWIENSADTSIHSVLVKGGAGEKTGSGPAPTGGFLYQYDGTAHADAGLHAAKNPNGKWAGVSHVSFCYTVTDEFEGCTLGYWKQEQHFGSWGPTGYETTDNQQDVFGPNAFNDTLLAALNYGGGPGVDGGKQILLKQAVAALLNAAHPDVNYAIDEGAVKTLVSAALNSGDRQTMIDLSDTLNAYNNQGCPLGHDPGP